MALREIIEASEHDADPVRVGSADIRHNIAQERQGKDGHDACTSGAQDNSCVPAWSREKPGGKERLDRFVGSFCAPCGAKTRWRGVSGVNSCPALLRGRAALPTRPIGHGVSTIATTSALGGRRAVGRLVAIRWRLRARCPAGEDDLHRSARRRRRGSLDVALRDALKLRRCWRLLWRRTVGKRVRRVDGGSTVRAGPAVHARSRAPVRDRLVGDLGDVASTGAPRVGTRLAGKVNRRYRSSPAAIGSPS